MKELWLQLFDDARFENGKSNGTRAEELMNLSIKAAEDISPNTRSYSSAQSGFALWHFTNERYAVAEPFQKRYIESEITLGIYPRELGNLYMFLAEIQLHQDDPGSALLTIDQAIEIYPADDFGELAAAYDKKSDLLSRRGRCEEAAEYKSLANEYERRQKDIELARRDTKENDWSFFRPKSKVDLEGQP